MNLVKIPSIDDTVNYKDDIVFVENTTEIIVNNKTYGKSRSWIVQLLPPQNR